MSNAIGPPRFRLGNVIPGKVYLFPPLLDARRQWQPQRQRRDAYTYDSESRLVRRQAGTAAMVRYDRLGRLHEVVGITVTGAKTPQLPRETRVLAYGDSSLSAQIPL